MPELLHSQQGVAHQGNAVKDAERRILTSMHVPETTVAKRRHTPGTQPAPGLTPVLLIALFGALRLAALTHQSLWYDEGYTLSLISTTNFRAFLKTFFSMTTSEHLQPVYYFFMYLWSRAAGTSDVAIRLPSALFCIVSMSALYRVARHAPGARRSAAIFAICGIGLSSYSIYYAQEARPYALIQMLAMVLLCVWIRSSRSFSGSLTTRSTVVLSVVCALCVLASSFSALLVLSLAFADLVAGPAPGSNPPVPSRFSRWLRVWTSPLIFSGACFASYWWLATQNSPSLVSRDITSIKQPLWMNIGYTIYGVLFGTTVGPPTELLRGPQRFAVALRSWPILLACLLVAAALAVGVLRALKRRWRGSPLLATVAVASVTYLVVFFGVFGAAGRLNILPRHASALFSLIVVLILLCASTLPASGGETSNRWLACGLGGWLIINLISLKSYYFAPEFRKDDYRSTAQITAKQAVPVFLAAGQLNLMQHYGAQSVIDATEVEPGNLSDFLRVHSNDAPTIEVVVNEFRGFRWDHSAPPAEVLSPDYSCATRRRLAYMDVIECRLDTARTLGGTLSSIAEAPHGGRPHVQ
ncbi:MAG TPA: glycosyltransferase family 39 protein [Acidisarcina sp.]